MRSCQNSKDLEEDRRRTASMYLETFCRVLSLLVETCGRILPPLEMLSSSSKAPPWSPKEVLHSSKQSQIRVATLLTKKLVLMTLYTWLYIEKQCPIGTLIGLDTYLNPIRTLRGCLAVPNTSYPRALSRPFISSNRVHELDPKSAQSYSQQEQDQEARATWLGEVGGQTSWALGPGEGLGSLGALVS